MPAGVAPKNAPKEKEDVKQDAKDSSTEAEGKEQAEPANAKGDGEEVDLEDSDLETLEQQKNIPYSRFKKVVEEKNNLKRQVDVELAESRTQLKTLTAQYEAKIEALKQSRQADEDPYELLGRGKEDDRPDPNVAALLKKIDQLNAKIELIESKNSTSELRIQLDHLEKKYPEADRLAVMGWKKASPGADLEELMEKSHNDNLDRIKSRVADIIQKKKEARNKKIITGPSGIKINSTEKPKNLREAANMTRQYLNSVQS